MSAWVFPEPGPTSDAAYQRARYDIEMIRETGFCAGIENYSRHLDGRAPGTRRTS